MSNVSRRGLVLLIGVVVALAGCTHSQSKTTQPSVAVAKQPTVPLGPPVQARVETISIPTYPVGPASDFPDFLKGSQQKTRPGLYPYTALRSLSFDKKDQDYQAYVLENEYLKITVLPALGGRLFSMYDKSSKQEVVYRQVSIKPGLVALRGAWISGGIEWDFPRSHSVSTMDTVSCQIIHHEDGSAGIVVGDTERSFHTSWAVEMRLVPGEAYMETHIFWQNPTSNPHDGYWWSNACFPANDQTQIIFPFYKTTGDGGGLNDWPIRDGKDMSWYKEYPSGTSTFRGAGDEDFFAAYDYGKDLALAQFADHTVMPGRKWFTWGNGPGGQTWAKTLSDDNRAYVEIQSGDPLTQGMQFHMQPHEQREYLEYWMPVSRIGPPARVNTNGAVRLTIENNIATVGVMTTRAINSAHIELLTQGRVIKQWEQFLSPAKVFKDAVPLNDVNMKNLVLEVYDENGKLIISHRYDHYAQGAPLAEPTPSEDRAARRAEVKVNPDEEDFKKGVQDIWEGNFDEARASLQPLTERIPVGVDRDAVRFYLGVADAQLDRAPDAMKQWDAIKTPGKMHDAAVIEAAKVLISEHLWKPEIGTELAAIANSGQAEAGAIYAVAARVSSDMGGARGILETCLERDPLDAMAQVEQAIIDGKDLTGLSALRDEERRIELASAYLDLRQYPIAERLLRDVPGQTTSATAKYLRAHILELTGSGADAKALRKDAASSSLRGCLPARPEELEAFQSAIRANDADSSAHYLSALVLYSRGRRDEALVEMTKAVALNPTDAIVYDSYGGMLREDNAADAVKQYEKALSIAPDSMDIYLHLDGAYVLVNESTKRIAALESAMIRQPTDDRIAHHLAIAYFDAGRYDDALNCYQAHHFRVAEGQRDIHDYYAMSLIGRALGHMKAGENPEALADLDAALEYPENLGIGKPPSGGGAPVIQYWRGIILSKSGQSDEAMKAWQDAAGDKKDRKERINLWSPLSGLDNVCTILALRRLGDFQAAEDVSSQLDKLLSRLQRGEFPEAKTLSAFLNASVAADGDPQTAGELLDQAQANPMQFAGYVRVARVWTELLAQQPSIRPTTRPKPLPTTTRASTRR